MKSIFFILIFILILFFSSTSFALNPTIKKSPIKIYVGEKVLINNWGFLSTSLWLKYEGFITGTIYRLQASSYWGGRHKATYHIDDSFIRIYFSDKLYYMFKVKHLSPSYIILQHYK